MHTTTPCFYCRRGFLISKPYPSPASVGAAAPAATDVEQHASGSQLPTAADLLTRNDRSAHHQGAISNANPSRPKRRGGQRQRDYWQQQQEQALHATGAPQAGNRNQCGTSLQPCRAPLQGPAVMSAVGFQEPALPGNLHAQAAVHAGMAAAAAGQLRCAKDTVNPSARRTANAPSPLQLDFTNIAENLNSVHGRRTIEQQSATARTCLNIH